MKRVHWIAPFAVWSVAKISTTAMMSLGLSAEGRLLPSLGFFVLAMLLFRFIERRWSEPC